ncbi:MAG: hypothetical protein JWR21_3470 [Herminiimonas sp.]|nr:hypothetical protein [Herminiimonas sp.]
MKPVIAANTIPTRGFAALRDSYNLLDQNAKRATTEPGGKENVAGGSASGKSITIKVRTSTTGAKQYGSSRSAVKDEPALAKISKNVQAHCTTVESVATSADTVAVRPRLRRRPMSVTGDAALAVAGKTMASSVTVEPVPTGVDPATVWPRLQRWSTVVNGDMMLPVAGMTVALGMTVESVSPGVDPATVWPRLQRWPLAVNGYTMLAVAAKTVAPGMTVESASVGVSPEVIHDQGSRALVEWDEDSSSLVESSDDSSSRVPFSAKEDWASESASDLTDSFAIDGTQRPRPARAQQLPAKKIAGVQSSPDQKPQGFREEGKAALDAYFKAMLEKVSGVQEKRFADHIKDSAFCDNGPVEFMAAFRTQCKDFFSSMEKAIERSFDAALIKKGVKPKPAIERKPLTEAEQQALDEARENFDLGPMARFGKKLAHTLVAPLRFNERIKARLNGESFSQAAGRAAFDRFPANGKAMLKDMVGSFAKLDDFRKLTRIEQEKTLRHAVTACIVTFGANKVSLDSVKTQLKGKQERADGVSAMALAQTYLKASFGLQDADLSGDSAAIANLVSASEKKRVSAFIDFLLEDACDGYVSTIVDPYSPAYLATTNESTDSMLWMVRDKPAAVDRVVRADVPRMSYVLVGRSATVKLPPTANLSDTEKTAGIEKVWDHIGHMENDGFRRRIAVCATQELKNAVIKLAFQSDGRFLQQYPGCLPHLKSMTSEFSIRHVSNDKTKVRLEGSFDGSGVSVKLVGGHSEKIGELKDFRMHYVTEVTISDKLGDLPIQLGPIHFTMENLTVHSAA